MKTISEEDKNRIKFKETIKAIEKVQRYCSFLKDELLGKGNCVRIHQSLLDMRLKEIVHELENAKEKFKEEYITSDFIDKIVEVAKEILECQQEA